MNNEVQFMDVIEPLKQMIAEQAYQIAYKDAVIKTQERTIEKLNDKIKSIKEQQEEETTNKDEGDK